MRKMLLSAAILCLSFFAAHAQLAGTKWGGTIKIPMQDGQLHPFAVVCSFQNDTMSMVYVLGKLPTDLMVYSEKDNILSVRKVSGGVPCDNTQIGKYSYEIKNEQLFLTKIEDACAARGAADISQAFVKMK